MEAIEGEVVDPTKVILCAPGYKASARAYMDRRGEYGGIVEESPACPADQLMVVDADLGDPPPFQFEAPRPLPPLPYLYGATMVRPSNIFKLIATA